MQVRGKWGGQKSLGGGKSQGREGFGKFRRKNRVAIRLERATVAWRGKQGERARIHSTTRRLLWKVGAGWCSWGALHRVTRNRRNNDQGISAIWTSFNGFPKNHDTKRTNMGMHEGGQRGHSVTGGGGRKGGVMVLKISNCGKKLKRAEPRHFAGKIVSSKRGGEEVNHHGAGDLIGCPYPKVGCHE